MCGTQYIIHHTPYIMYESMNCHLNLNSEHHKSSRVSLISITLLFILIFSVNSKREMFSYKKKRKQIKLAQHDMNQGMHIVQCTVQLRFHEYKVLITFWKIFNIRIINTSTMTSWHIIFLPANWKLFSWICFAKFNQRISRFCLLL